MKYVLVNLRANAECDCNSCYLPLKKTYVRDLGTGLVYHNPWCFEVHVHDSLKAIGAFDGGESAQTV